MYLNILIFSEDSIKLYIIVIIAGPLIHRRLYNNTLILLIHLRLGCLSLLLSFLQLYKGYHF